MLLMFLGCSTPTPPLLVLAPSSTQVPVERLVRDWATSEGTTATVVFDDSPALSRMVDAGTPADLLLLSDVSRMDRLIEREHVLGTSRAPLAGDDLVAFVSVSATRTPRDLDTLLDGDQRMFAPPESSAESLHLRAQLDATRRWHEAKPRLTYVHDEAAVLDAVVADPGSVGFLSSGRANLGANIEITFALISPAPALVIEGAVVAHAERADTAGTLLDFLGSDGAEAPFRARGFRGLELGGGRPPIHATGPEPTRGLPPPAPASPAHRHPGVGTDHAPPTDRRVQPAPPRPPAPELLRGHQTHGAAK